MRKQKVIREEAWIMKNTKMMKGLEFMKTAFPELVSKVVYKVSLINGYI